MERRHARYPFLDAAREAVEREGVDIVEEITDDGPGRNPVVERATERVVTAIHEGETGTPHRRDRVELVSYPVARALVSALDRPALTERYAAAEARTARERFAADADPDVVSDVVSDVELSLSAFLSAFDLAEDVKERNEGYEISVGPYLELAGGIDGEAWRLVRRRLADGTVPIEGDELDALLEQAVRRRVAEGLPLSVPEPIVAALEGPIETVERELADYSPRREIDTVVPELFPPCMRALLDRVGDGEELPPRSAFVLGSFLTSIGLSADGARALAGLDDELEPFPEAYAPPNCETMAAQGDCVNKDERCESVPTPLAYYEDALDDAGEAD